MKCIIQIPCYNEEKTLPGTLADLPRALPGFDSVEWLIIDDGSSDRTVEVAREHGVDHIIRHPHNLGLARGFMTGLMACLERGADVVVNTDADNQYVGEDIALLTAPIVEGRADIVVGARPIGDIEDFSPLKKKLQNLGSAVVRMVSRTDVPDAPSGFRAMSAEAARRLNVHSEYTYTLETIIQAGQKGMAITSVPVRTNRATRPSRLVKSIPAYIRRSVLTMLRIFVVYQPFRFFMAVGGIIFGLGLLLGLRFLYFFATGDGGGHVQSLILASILLGMGFQTVMTAFVADLISVNRKLLEELQYRHRRKGDREAKGQPSPPGAEDEA